MLTAFAINTAIAVGVVLAMLLFIHLWVEVVWWVSLTARRRRWAGITVWTGIILMVSGIYTFLTSPI